MSFQGISGDLLKKLADEVSQDRSLQLAQAAAAKHDPLEVCLDRAAAVKQQHVFNVKISSEGKPMTNQRSSGRCWLFAACNVMRIPLMQRLNVDELELSQNYLFFYEKLERANYLMDAYIETAGEPADGRLVSHLLNNPLDDGGQWDMVVNIVDKYGIVPKQYFPDAWSASNSRRVQSHCNTKLREACIALRAAVNSGAKKEDVESIKTDFLAQIYSILNVCLGTPPTELYYEYTDKDKKYQSLGPISPKQFYDQYIKPDINLSDMISLIHDPREGHDYNTCYTVQFLGNMSHGRQTLHVNLAIDQLKQLVLKSLNNNQAVWFGCDVGKHYHRESGLEDLSIHRFDLLYGLSLLKMSKAERLVHGDSLMTHAMVITAACTNEAGQPIRYRVENSWGTSDKDTTKGYLLMTDDWFSEFVYQVVVHKDLVSPEVLEARQKTPIVLPAWDPMGSLA